MRILIVPASPQTSRTTIHNLLTTPQKQDPIHIRGLYRNLTRVPPEFQTNPNFESYPGDLSDPATLNFHSFDTVFFVLPPCYDGTNLLQWATTVSTNVRLAIQRSGTVKRLVLLSSMGAEFEGGTGEIMTNHISEEILKDAASEVIIMRCAYFMENWAAAVETVRSDRPYLETVITPVEFAVPMVAVKDIGYHSMQSILMDKVPQTPYVFELQGPRDYTPVDVQRAFEKVLGRQVELRPVAKENLEEFFGRFLPKVAVGPFVEMTLSFLPGGVMHTDAKKREGVKVYRGEMELEEVVSRLLSHAGG
ncbi:NAD(P)-binding protein [Aspergillus homomorphus CBS 101889]|uniref:NAD(P)-binding protein n=1 Tax=Aspergillus homomorphus (strain CBS 101889) TaxID=1450537 RepID=A0A395HI96_ASPHC|nr:NAD(P)-binding protein [Aspergillus homomorphus CBS 101889]RAL07632.1 NAD(P)-binding protein [Aspergillus homomorphus CBS 101889]